MKIMVTDQGEDQYGAIFQCDSELSVRWYFNDLNNIIHTGKILVIDVVFSEHEGTYYCMGIHNGKYYYAKANFRLPSM